MLALNGLIINNLYKMGDVGRYEAQLVAVYPRKIKIKESNSDEAIEDFLKLKPNFSKVGSNIDSKESTLENINNGKYVGYLYQDEYGDMTDTFEEPLTSKNERHYWDYAEDITALIKITVEELRYLDLKILAGHDYYDENCSYDEEISLVDISNYIYCYNNNATGSRVKISKEILQDLVDGKCELYLSGDGHGNC